MSSASKIVEWAKNQLGTKETGTNINPYAKFIDNNYPNFYNYKKQGVAWCDVFVDCGFIQCFGVQEALRLLCQPEKSAGAGCRYSYGYYKAKGRAGKEPKVGAQIFFGKSEPEINHTGIVVNIIGDKVYTVEGNKNNQVSACTYNRYDSKIYGYGYPDFTETEEPVAPVVTPAPSKPQTTVYTVVKGDTLSRIATAHGLTLNGLLAINPDIKNPNLIRVGQKINIRVVESLISYDRYKVNTERSNLNIRKQPNADCQIIGELAKGFIVEVEKIENGWAKLAKREGYCSAAYLVKI